jgi:hypothetical protein
MFKKTRLFVILSLVILSVSDAVNSSGAPSTSNDSFSDSSFSRPPSNESFSVLSLSQLPPNVFTAFLKDSENLLSTTTHEASPRRTRDAFPCRTRDAIRCRTYEAFPCRTRDASDCITYDAIPCVTPFEASYCRTPDAFPCITPFEAFRCIKKPHRVNKPSAKSNNANVSAPPVAAQAASNEIPAELPKRCREEQKIETPWKWNNSSSRNPENTAASASQQPSSGFSQNNSIGIPIPTTKQNSLPRDASAMPKKTPKVQAAACDCCCLQ